VPETIDACTSARKFEGEFNDVLVKVLSGRREPEALRIGSLTASRI